MNIELITIIVPVYNVAFYLRMCIDSILAQTYTHLEIILVNDGSTDHCGAICDEYALKDSRIKVIHQVNQGLSAARNTGISVAQGAYIGFVDSDDCISPDMYSILYNMITFYKADMAMCGFLCKRENGEFEYSKALKEIKIYTFQEIIKAFLTGIISVNVWSKLYKREVVNKNIFPVGQCYEDLYTMPTILLQCEKVVVTDTPYYYYTYRSDSISNTYTVELVSQHFNSVIRSSLEIQTRCPELRLLVVKFKVKYDILIYDTLLKKVEPSPERENLMHAICTDLRQYQVSELWNGLKRHSLPTLLLRHLPVCYPAYSLMRRAFREYIWKYFILKLKKIKN